MALLWLTWLLTTRWIEPPTEKWGTLAIWSVSWFTPWIGNTEGNKLSQRLSHEIRTKRNHCKKSLAIWVSMFSRKHCCRSGSFLTPGSGIQNRFFPDLGSRIPNPYYWELNDNFLGKKHYNSCQLAQIFSVPTVFKNKVPVIINF